MDIKEAIRGRRSLGAVKPDPVPRELLEEILEAATWAPNHRCTEPWRFIVMTGEGRAVLGNAYADIAEAEAGSSSEEIRTQHIKKAFRAPAVIAVAAVPSGDPLVPWIEELAATHCAVQNMLLTAHALGLAAIWRTGEPAYHPLMHEAFDLKNKEQLVGFLYIGYPLKEAPQQAKTAHHEKTRWIE